MKQNHHQKKSEVGGELCDIEGSVENSSELEKHAEVEKPENSALLFHNQFLTLRNGQLLYIMYH